MKKKKIFYGWIIVFSCMILAAASTGMLSYLNPLFVQPVTEYFGISRATFMIYQTFATIATVICMPLASSLCKKVPMKVMILVGACFGAGAHLCYSLARSVGWFYLGGALGGIGTCLYGSIPIAVLLSNWFQEKKGVATGIAFAGTGAASAILSPVISHIIAEYGWRAGYRLISGLILCCVVPVALLLIRVTPEEMGLLPYGGKRSADGTVERTGFSRTQVFRTKSFWTLAMSIFLLGMVTTPAQQQMVAYWTGAGNTPTFAATLYSLLMTVAIFTKIFLGAVYDGTSIFKGTLVVGSLAVASYLCLLLFPIGYAAMIPAVLYGVTVSVQVLVGTYVVNRLFGDKEYAFIYGILTPVLYGGVAVGSPLSAAIFDRTGSYRMLWIACAVIFAIGVGLVILSDRLSQREYRSILGVERK